MTIIDYLLIGVVAAAAIYIVYRLFLGWRNSAFPRQTLAAIRYWRHYDDIHLDDRVDESEKGGELNTPTKAQPHRRIATGGPWKPPAKASD
jgi:hypothetical protein